MHTLLSCPRVGLHHHRPCPQVGLHCPRWGWVIISGQYTAQVGMGDNQRTIHGMMDMDMDMDMDIDMDMDMGMDNGFPTMRVSSRCCAAMFMAI